MKARLISKDGAQLDYDVEATDSVRHVRIPVHDAQFFRRGHMNFRVFERTAPDEFREVEASPVCSCGIMGQSDPIRVKSLDEMLAGL